jgi:hypothetical protein
MDEHGRSMRVDSRETMSQLASAGFVDISEQVIRVPFNGWPVDEAEREVGQWFNLGFTMGLEALSLAPLARMRNRTKEEIVDLANKVKMEICTRRVHAYCLL